MSMWQLVIASSIVVFCTNSSLAAKKPSLLSAYVGRYAGTMVLTTSSGTTPLSVAGVFRASTKREKGSLLLSGSAGTTFNIQEQYQFRKPALTYLFSQSISGAMASGAGSGSVNIKSKKISYAGTFEFLGQPYTLMGTMRLVRKKLKIVEFISGPSMVTIVYDLRRKGKK